MVWAIAIGVVSAIVALGFGLRWYLRRAGRIDATNASRRAFQKNLLLDLQEIRDGADDELSGPLDRLIETARVDTPAGNETTAELDAQIEAAIAELKASPNPHAVESISLMLANRNRWAKR